MRQFFIALSVLLLGAGQLHAQLALNLSGQQDSVKTTYAGVGLIANVERLHGAGVNAIFNIVRDEMHGVQIGGLANVAHDVKGIQLSAISNMSAGEVRGVQIAPVTNISVSADHTLQLAGLANVCTREMRGMQMAYGNYAGEVDGLQLGVVNLCGGEVKGIQIGLVNYSAEPSSHKIGLVNITPATRIQMMVFGGNTSKTNLAVRFKNRYTYTILGGGTHYLDLNDKFSGCLFYRAGTYLTLSPKLTLSGDLGFFHVENFENESVETPERMYSLQARLNIEYRLSRGLSLFASGGYGMTRYYDDNKFYERKPIIEAGILLF